MKKILLTLLLLAWTPAFAALRCTVPQVNTSVGTSAVVTMGACAPQSGDIILMAAEGGNGGTNTFTYPSGFVAISGAGNLNLGSGDATFGIGCKVATGSEPSTYTLNYSTSDFISVHVRVYSGRTASCAITAVNSTNNAGALSPITYALNGVTAATGDDVVTFVGNRYYDGAVPSYTQASGFANSLLSYTATMYATILTSADKVNSASGATGTIGGTYTNADGDTQYYGGYVISLAAAGGAAAPTNGGLLFGRNEMVKPLIPAATPTLN